MIPRIKSVEAKEDYRLLVEFDDGQTIIYDVKDDIDSIKDFEPLKTQYGLFQNVQLDESRTIIYWNDRIDLPSDTLMEYGKEV